MPPPRVAVPLPGDPYAPPATAAPPPDIAAAARVLATLRCDDVVLTVGRSSRTVLVGARQASREIGLEMDAAAAAAWAIGALALLRVEVRLDAGDEVAYRTPALCGVDGQGELTAHRTISASGSAYMVRLRHASEPLALALPADAVAALIDALRAAAAAPTAPPNRTP